jgi:hypothetical protein
MTFTFKNLEGEKINILNNDNSIFGLKLNEQEFENISNILYYLKSIIGNKFVSLDYYDKPKNINSFLLEKRKQTEDNTNFIKKLIKIIDDKDLYIKSIEKKLNFIENENKMFYEMLSKNKFLDYSEFKVDFKKMSKL